MRLHDLYLLRPLVNRVERDKERGVRFVGMKVLKNLVFVRIRQTTEGLPEREEHTRNRLLRKRDAPVHYPHVGFTVEVQAVVFGSFIQSICSSAPRRPHFSNLVQPVMRAIPVVIGLLAHKKLPCEHKKLPYEHQKNRPQGQVPSTREKSFGSFRGGYFFDISID